jgi:hypothetical protein
MGEDDIPLIPNPGIPEMPGLDALNERINIALQTGDLAGAAVCFHEMGDVFHAFGEQLEGMAKMQKIGLPQEPHIPNRAERRGGHHRPRR